MSQRACIAREVVENDAGVCKVFETETTHALLGKVDSSLPSGCSASWHHQQPLACVLSVESCIAKVTKRALERVTTP